MKKLIYLSLGLAITFASCSDDDDDKYYKEPANPGSTLTLEGGAGGAQAANSVYVDFSTATQASVERKSWHLGFNCGSEFGVFLNNTSGSRAIEAREGMAVNTALTKQDSIAYASSLSMAMEEGKASNMGMVDAFDGAISGTVIKAGKVYIYDNEDPTTPLYKVSVAKKDNDTYTLTYAAWNANEVKTLEIKKNADYTMIGVSLTQNKTLNVQPQKTAWDIVWGRNTYEAPAMQVNTAFIMSDIVFINKKNGVEAVMIMTEDIAYDDYKVDKVATTEFSSNIGAIGDSWRSVAGGGSTAGLKSDVFYVIKDTEGNVYKLKFMAMGVNSDGGERGKPQLKYALVKEAQ